MTEAGVVKASLPEQKAPSAPRGAPGDRTGSEQHKRSQWRWRR